MKEEATACPMSLMSSSITSATFFRFAVSKKSCGIVPRCCVIFKPSSSVNPGLQGALMLSCRFMMTEIAWPENMQATSATINLKCCVTMKSGSKPPCAVLLGSPSAGMLDATKLVSLMRSERSTGPARRGESGVA